MARIQSKPVRLIDEEIGEGPDAEALLDEGNEAEEPSNTAEAFLADKPMFASLLQRAVAKILPGDTVLLDYVQYVAEPLSSELALVPAKGGADFIAQRRAEGKSDAEVERYRRAQSMRAHLVNGLLPTAHIARQLKAWGAPRLMRFDERVYRLFCAGFTLHDWLKLPGVETRLEKAGLSHASVSAVRDLSVIEDIFRQWCNRLGLDAFLAPIGGVDAWLHDLIYLASNTQVRWGTMLNLSALPRLALDGRARQLATDLCTLADLIAYVGRTPRAVVSHPSITEAIANLSNGEARLMHHHVAENRGVLTNFVHNAAVQALASTNCVPLLYAPSGVVYLMRGALPGWSRNDLAELAERVVERIREACGTLLWSNLTGFSRDGKGLKYASYYDLHFDIAGRIAVAAKATFTRIPDTKRPSAGQRFLKIAQAEMAPAGADVALPDDIRVDQLAEFCALASKIASERIPLEQANGILLEQLHLLNARDTFQAISDYPRSGGVSYNWYYIAGTYLKHGRGKGASPDEWRALVQNLATALAEVVRPAAANGQTPQEDGWDDVRTYVRRVLTLGPHTSSNIPNELKEAAASELARYSMAKAQGRGATAVCSLCSSSYQVEPQREAGILFAPQVYSNKQPLHSLKAIRNICRICQVEMMLRQILMNRGAVSGGRFEGRRVRYLYFYPTYFFTPETLAQMELIYHQLKRLSFTSVRKALANNDGAGATLRLDAQDLQRLGPLMMLPEAPDPAEDRLVRMQFPVREPVTFFFLGIPPQSRDAKDAEAWVNPAFLALALPLAVDVKVVASESLLPLMNEADELDEMVFFDAAHVFVQDIVGRERIPLERLLPNLQALISTYMIHLDGNANFAKGDYRWHTIPALARNLATDSKWAFAYLKRWQRSQKLDSIPGDKAHLYLQFVEILDRVKGKDSMSHARELTDRYMRFYRAKRRNSNSILRPITITAKAILAADPRLFEREGLVEAVRGELRSFMNRVQSGGADGRLAPGSDWQSREAAMHDFADYFVGTLFYDTLSGDRSALRGKQLNLIKNACEVIYSDTVAQEWRDRSNANEQDEED